MNVSKKSLALAKLIAPAWDYLGPKLSEAGFVPSWVGYQRAINAGKLSGDVHIFVNKGEEGRVGGELIDSNGFLNFQLLVRCVEIEAVVVLFSVPTKDYESITFSTSTNMLIKAAKAHRIDPAFSGAEFEAALDSFLNEFLNQGLQSLIKIMQPATLLKQMQYKQTKIYTSESLAAREFALLILLGQYDQVLDQLSLLEKGYTWAMNNVLTPSHVPVLRQLIADTREMAP